MRFQCLRSGDVRIRSFFAFFPVEANGEVRWLERVTIEEVFKRYTYDDFWEVIRFID